ncbi:MAG TPA: glycosyltransferase [Pirellulales bacterium]|nr:glycosyltransferase [Pirellulales bacterium]
MPTYNGERFLEQALASVAAQHDEDIEIVAVDDGSTDRTLGILRRWSRHVRGVAVIERRRTGNWVSSTAVGMAAARGRYLCWLHQDDTWRPGRAAVLRRVLAAHPAAALVVHPCWYTGVRGERIGYWRCALARKRGLLTFAEVARPLLVQCSIAACGAIFSAEAVRAVGSPDTSLLYHADWDYWLRLARLERTLHVTTPLASFRIHPASQTIGLAAEADRRLVEARAVFRRHMPHFAACGGDAGRVERIAAVSTEVNYALNSLFAGVTIDFRHLLYRVAALGPSGCATLLRDSRLVERCVSRLQAKAGLRPLLCAGMAAIARHYTGAAAVPLVRVAMPNAGDIRGDPERA